MNEERGRIMLTRDTGNIVMPVESIETFLSEVVDYVNRHAGIEDLEQVDTAEIRENIGKTENVQDILDMVDGVTVAEKEPEPKSDLKTYDVFIYDKESGTDSPMRCQAKNTEEAMKMADEYIERWNNRQQKFLRILRFSMRVLSLTQGLALYRTRDLKL